MITHIISIALISIGLFLSFWGFYVANGSRWHLIPSVNKEDCNNPEAFLNHIKVGLLISGLGLFLSGLLINFSIVFAQTISGIMCIFLVIWNLKRNQYVSKT